MGKSGTAADCIECGQQFTKRVARQVRCPECQRKRTAERHRANSAARYARLKGLAAMPSGIPAKKSRAGLCDAKTCAKCVYSCMVSNSLACDYLGVTGERRGCPAGAGCDKRKTGRRKRANGFAYLKVQEADECLENDYL